jgi:MtN3 and saliva related transmembrane protein
VEGVKDMVEPWIEAIGLLAGLLGIVAWVPQIREVWVHQRHEGISLSTFSVVTLALVLWLVYGVLIDSVAMIVANVFTLVVILAVLIGVRRLRRLENEAAA